MIPDARATRLFEPGEGDEGFRTRFQRDRDAIIYTTAFRRLAGVTQVVSPSEGLVIHNRLTHTLEVAQIALRLAEDLNRIAPAGWIEAQGGLDPIVVEAAALAHDLGHPPFGHIAETTLNKLMVKAGNVDGYEGNAQAFRIITRLAVRRTDIEGLNLTRATLNATLKYPWLQKEGVVRKQAERKWGAYYSEWEYFWFARELQPVDQLRHRSLEAHVMDWADDIAYSVSDTEDFFRAGLIPLERILANADAAHQFVTEVFARWKALELTDKIRGPFQLDELRAAFVSLLDEVPPIALPFQDRREDRAAIRAFTSFLIARYIRDTKPLASPADGECLSRPREHLMEVKMLKELTWQYVIKNSALAGQQYGQQQVITKLFEIYREAIGSRDPDDWDILPARDRAARQLHARNDGSIHPDVGTRMTADAIAGMTDQQALLMYHRLTGITPGGAFDAQAR